MLQNAHEAAGKGAIALGPCICSHKLCSRGKEGRYVYGGACKGRKLCILKPMAPYYSKDLPHPIKL
jgi:hypothetical protein